MDCDGSFEEGGSVKGIGSKVVRTLQMGSRVLCHDNSGAKEVQIITFLHQHGRRGRRITGGVGDVAVASVKKGRPDMVGKVVKVLVIRQKKPYRRPNGIFVSFEDNAVVVVNDDYLPVGTEIKGVVAREVAERFPKVAAIAPAVV